MQTIHNLESYLSPTQLAKALGVSESSIKRWVDQGRISASRTAGGHRRIQLQDALRFVRESQTKPLAPGILLPSLRPETLNMESLALPLDSALIQGDSERVQGMLIGSFLSGFSNAQIWDDLVAPAMDRIGRLWKHDQDGVLVEHRSIDTCLQVLYQIRSLLPQPAADAPRALGGALEGDPYLLPTLGAATVLTELGWSATNFGPLTPVTSLARSMKMERPSLVWVSFSRPAPEKQLRYYLSYLAEKADQLGASLVVGGRGLPPTLNLPSPKIFRGANMRDLSSFAQGIVAATHCQRNSNKPEN